MTSEEFREIALNLRDSAGGVTEGAHQNHADFRAHGRIFATLGYPDPAWGMVKLAPQEQRQMLAQHPLIFTPAKGAWGLQGSTLVRLQAASSEVVEAALGLAFQQNAAAQSKRPTASRKRAPKPASKRVPSPTE